MSGDGWPPLVWPMLVLTARDTAGCTIARTHARKGRGAGVASEKCHKSLPLEVDWSIGSAGLARRLVPLPPHRNKRRGRVNRTPRRTEDRTGQRSAKVCGIDGHTGRRAAAAILFDGNGQFVTVIREGHFE